MADGDPIRIGQDNIANTPGAETLLRRAANSARQDPVITVRTPVRGDAIHGEASGERTGVEGTSPGGFGLRGASSDGNGVRGSSSRSTGVAGDSSTGNGVGGSSNQRPGVAGFSLTSSGVRGDSQGGAGVEGFTSSGSGVRGSSSSGSGVVGAGTLFGVSGDSPGFMGVSGTSVVGIGVRGLSTSNFGVAGSSTSRSGVSGTSTGAPGVSGGSSGAPGVPAGPGVSGTSTGAPGVPAGPGVSGTSTGARGVPAGPGVSGTSLPGSPAVPAGPGVNGTSTGGPGVSGTSTGAPGVLPGPGVSGTTPGAPGVLPGPAGVFGGAPPFTSVGGVFFGGITVVAGLKLFKIDHPLDPENRYLLHTCVESSEMKNIYDGVVQLDEDGSGWVQLPQWFEALNGDFRYQLTPVGGSAPGLHVAEELSENRFKIGGGQDGMKVCWQVTGSRKDPAAAAHPFEVEQDKREEERGRYLEPGLYDAPEAQSLMGGPTKEAVEEAQGRAEEAVEEAQGPSELSGIDVARLEEERLRRLDEWRRLVKEQGRETLPPSFDFVGLEEDSLRQLDEWRRLVEEQGRGDGRTASANRTATGGTAGEHVAVLG
jgi:hypothetical protein